MARVPGLEAPRIQSEAFGGRVHVDTPADAFGAAKARAFTGVGKAFDEVGRVLGVIGAHERAEYDRARLAEADAGLSRDLDNAFYDPKEGFLSKRGRNAIEGVGNYQKQLTDLGEKYLNGLDERQREKFKNIAARRIEVAYKGGLIHATSENRKFVEDAAQSRIETLRDEAANNYHDDSVIRRNMNATLSELVSMSDRQGWDAATTKEKADKLTTAVHNSVILRFAEDDISGARKYFEKNRDEIKSDHQVRIERLLDDKEAAFKRERHQLLSGQVRDAIFVLDRGKTPAGVDELLAGVEGTEFAAPLQEAIKDRQAVSEFMRHPLARQKAILHAINDQETFDRRTVELTQRLQRANDHLTREVAGGRGLEAAADLGVIDRLIDIDLSNPMSLAARAGKARIASQHFGYPVAPFTKGEVEWVRDRIAKAPAEQTAGLLSSLHAGLGENGAMAVAGSMKIKSPEISFALAVVPDRPELARDLIAGGRLLKENSEVRPSKDNLAPIVADVVGNAFELTGGSALAPLVDAASALYASRRVPGGDFKFDTDTYEKALRDVMGEPVKLNGRTIMPPVPGMDAGKIREHLLKMSPDDLAKHGNGKPVFADGMAFTSDRFESRFIGPSAQLVTSGFGRYLVYYKGIGFVSTPEGEPYEIDLAGFLKGSR